MITKKNKSNQLYYKDKINDHNLQTYSELSKTIVNFSLQSENEDKNNVNETENISNSLLFINSDVIELTTNFNKSINNYLNIDDFFYVGSPYTYDIIRNCPLRQI